VCVQRRRVISAYAQSTHTQYNFITNAFCECLDWPKGALCCNARRTVLPNAAVTLAQSVHAFSLSTKYNIVLLIHILAPCFCWAPGWSTFESQTHQVGPPVLHSSSCPSQPPLQHTVPAGCAATACTASLCPTYSATHGTAAPLLLLPFLLPGFCCCSTPTVPRSHSLTLWSLPADSSNECCCCCWPAAAAATAARALIPPLLPANSCRHSPSPTARTQRHFVRICQFCKGAAVSVLPVLLKATARWTALPACQHCCCC
jgi:hypothetical protein